MSVSDSNVKYSTACSLLITYFSQTRKTNLFFICSCFVYFLFLVDLI